MDVIKEIKQVINDNQVLLFMKGTPDFPQCGFSMKTVEALKACKAEFGYVDILAAPDIRANLPKISNWPTFPQLFIKGELIGGCDIVMDLYQKGELQGLLDKASTGQ
jgi:monothiol glutaredoxin